MPTFKIDFHYDYTPYAKAPTGESHHYSAPQFAKQGFLKITSHLRLLDYTAGGRF